MKPRIIIADEPTTALDVTIQAQFLQLLKSIQEEFNLSLIVVTHDLASAFRIADRITVLDRGKILAIGTVDEIRNSTNDRIQALITRRFEEEELDAEEYIRRLVGEKQNA